MKILIICSFYPPDSAISAVRPYMFAKYLSRLGNTVTVLRSGAFNSTPDESYIKLKNINVISYLGDKCDAELFDKNQFDNHKHIYAISKSNSKFRKYAIIRKIFHYLIEPINSKKRIKQAKYNFNLQKRVIDSINEKYDVVISTYSELENVFAGEYAAKHFGAKWIMDFRDSIVDHMNHNRYIWNLYAKKYEMFTLRKADLCTTVSNGLRQELGHLYKNASVITLYNGFDVEEKEEDNHCLYHNNTNNKLTICYTGQIYDLRLNGLKHFVVALKNLIENKTISKDQISFVYAGRNSDIVSKLFDEHSISDVLVDHGQIARTQAIALQNDSDVFLVLSWNTRSAKGILTGKFYEGIRANKPIISIVEGDIPNSELLELNSRYNYGFCYESCNKNMSSSDIERYIYNLCNEKQKTGQIVYKPSQDLFNAFCYEGIVKKLYSSIEQICCVPEE